MVRLIVRPPVRPFENDGNKHANDRLMTRPVRGRPIRSIRAVGLLFREWKWLWRCMVKRAGEEPKVSHLELGIKTLQGLKEVDP